jgi:uncharacterized phage infection (PIP) family protein YhgE
MQISFITDPEVFLSPKEENGSITEVGKTTNVNFTMLPAMPGDFAFSSKVQNFEMPDIDIAGSPYSMDIDGLEDLDLLFSASKDLSDGADEIYDGMKKSSKETVAQLDKISSGDTISEKDIDKLKDGASDLKKGAAELNENITKVREQITALKKAYSQDKNLQSFFAGIDALLSAQNSFNTGTISFADVLISSFANLDLPDLTKMLATYKKQAEQMPESFLEYKNGMNKFNSSIQEIKNNNLISGEWKPVSFSTDKKVDKVLFIMKAKGLAKNEEEAEAMEEEELSLLEKIKRLFS